jgi:hypothetical protein
VLKEKDVDETEKHVATSNLFIGREWDQADGRDAYSGLRVEIDLLEPITNPPNTLGVLPFRRMAGTIMKSSQSS